MKKSIILSAFLLAFSTTAYSSTEWSPRTEITRVEPVVAFGETRVYFFVKDKATKCSNGYWSRRSDPGYEQTMSILLSAIHTNMRLRVQAYTEGDNLLGSNKLCRVRAFRIDQQ